MQRKDIKIGMKVRPVSKTAKGWEGLASSGQWKQSKQRGYMFVSGFDLEEGPTVVTCANEKSCRTGDYFMPGDLRPYVKAKAKKKAGKK
jgi:hypothetical protein